MTEQARVSPGWYSAGVPGEERWWDGNAWTAYARPSQPLGQQPAAPGVAPGTATFWRGSKEGSLIAAILCVLLTFPAAFGVLWGLLSGSIAFLIPGLGWLMFVAFAVLMFLNFAGLRRQEAAARAVQPPLSQQAPSTGEASPPL